MASGRDVVGAAMILIVGMGSSALATRGSERDDPGPAKTVVRIKTEDPEIARAIALAIDWSDTFRRLVETIERTDGMVWIVRGRCHAMSACLLIYLEVSGPNRMLRIQVDPRRPEKRLMESLGHELSMSLKCSGPRREAARRCTTSSIARRVGIESEAGSKLMKPCRQDSLWAGKSHAPGAWELHRLSNRSSLGEGA